MSRIIKLLNNETIEIVEYSKANACFQTNKYPNDELFCVIREQINPFDMFQKKLSLEQEIERLNNIINRIDSFVDRTIEVIKQQSTGDDEWILERLNGIKYLTELKEEK